MGLGLLGGGVGAATFFASRGAHVVVTDTKTEEQLSESIQKLSGLSVDYILGKHREEDFITSDLIIKNPSVASNSPFLTLARENHVPVHMAESLFMSLSPTKNIIGITGTRGKSTTTALIYNVLKASGCDVYTAGNIPGDSTLSLLDKVKDTSWVVLELSSWQLESFGWWHISPHVAVITNIYEDHLNRYRSMESYFSDKKNIFLFQKKDDVFVTNNAQPVTRSFASEANGKTVLFDRNSWPIDEPLGIPGTHNIENAGACYVACTSIGVDEDCIVQTVRSFTGLPGRLECIRELDGVNYINDTTSTTPVSAIRALQSFPERKVILIAGGSSKNLPVDALADEIVSRAKSLILIQGDGTDMLIDALRKRNYFSDAPVVCETLAQAVREARANASAGDIILFSPGFASFSMYTNEFARGRDYVTTVTSLQAS